MDTATPTPAGSQTHPSWRKFIETAVGTDRTLVMEAVGPTSALRVPITIGHLLGAIGRDALFSQPCEIRLVPAEPNLLVVTSGDPF